MWKALSFNPTATKRGEGIKENVLVIFWLSTWKVGQANKVSETCRERENQIEKKKKDVGNLTNTSQKYFKAGKMAQQVKANTIPALHWPEWVTTPYGFETLGTVYWKESEMKIGLSITQEDKFEILEAIDATSHLPM